MPPILIVFGDKTASEVVETAAIAYPNKFSRIERNYFEEPAFSSVHLPRLSQYATEVYYNIGVADVRVKQIINDRCTQLGWTPFSVVHPSAIVSPSAKLGLGSFVGPLAVISTNAVIGDHCIVHLHASIGHDASIGGFCAILPGARISGAVEVGHRVLIGSNAFVAAGVRIGNDCQVDALTYVSRELKEGFLQSVRSAKPVKRVI